MDPTSVAWTVISSLHRRLLHYRISTNLLHPRLELRLTCIIGELLYHSNRLPTAPLTTVCMLSLRPHGGLGPHVISSQRFVDLALGGLRARAIGTDGPRGLVVLPYGLAR